MNCLGVDPWTALCAAVLALVWFLLGAFTVGFVEVLWRAWWHRRKDDDDA